MKKVIAIMAVTTMIMGMTFVSHAAEAPKVDMKQLEHPTGEFVMNRLAFVDTIVGSAAVTEDHDPNSLLGKQGGYIGCIYFRDNEIPDSELREEELGDIIEMGTDGGGAIEIFGSVKNAQGRDTYLSTIDSFISSGSHYVYGTCVIRTSRHLTATQQKALTDKIVFALSVVDTSVFAPAA